MLNIKFGTDGWRAIIAQDYTTENVARVSMGLAKWLLAKNNTPSVIIGHDCRFAGELFAETTAKVLCEQGIKVYIAKGFVSTPMVSLGCKTYNADQGVVITASHNPPSYNGYKLKGAHGGPTNPSDIAAVEALIPDTEVVIPTTSIDEYVAAGKIEFLPLEDMYVDYLRTKFDFDKLNNSPFKLGYDAMYGAGQNVVRRLMPSAFLLHCEHNPSFNGTAPEPLYKNTKEFAEIIKNTPELKIGLVTDGDADRIGLYDEDGNFVDAHHILLLLVHYLAKYKEMIGNVVIAFSVTDRVKRLCEKHNLPVEVTKIGFKYISEKMVTEDVLVGGEESGGIAVKGHIPERDGIYDGLVLLEFMTETGKSLKELIQEIYDEVGSFVYQRDDLTLDNTLKETIINNAEQDVYNEAGFGAYQVARVEKIDGVKYHLTNGGWVMLRASGTEPLLRVYAEGSNETETLDILKSVKDVILK